MNILFVSDLHLPSGPKDFLRPEMRKNLRFLPKTGRRFADHVDRQLRLEAYAATELSERWLLSHDSNFDLIVNGGDNALPLSHHADRMIASESIWKVHLGRYGEDRYLALTGNHELGHGYDAEPAAYPDLMKMRDELFAREVNRVGYGVEHFDDFNLVLIDSELIFLAEKSPFSAFIRSHAQAMRSEFTKVLKSDLPIVILTHNSTRVLNWISAHHFWSSLTRGDRRVILSGGHYHVPRRFMKRGVEVLWTGGASYPEPWLRHLVRVPFTGFCCHGQGAVEIRSRNKKIRARHIPFSMPYSPNGMKAKQSTLSV